jgi:hypothetical protein
MNEKDIKEIALNYPDNKQKGLKSNTLIFWHKDKIEEFSKNLINLKFKGVLPLQTENKKGLYDVLINSQYKDKKILYPSYDLKILITDYLKTNNYSNFIVKSYKNNLGFKSFLKVDLSNIKKK